MENFIFDLVSNVGVSIYYGVRIYYLVKKESTKRKKRNKT